MARCPRAHFVLCEVNCALFAIIQATVCLCDRDTCNGPSLPPREMIEEQHEIIDIEQVQTVLLVHNTMLSLSCQVIREMENAAEAAEPEPVSAGGTAVNTARTFLILLLGLAPVTVRYQ